MPSKYQKVMYDPELQSLDVTLAQHMEIMIRNDGKVIWINEGGRCLLRVCGIEGEIILNDQRKKKKNAIRTNDK